MKDAAAKRLVILTGDALEHHYVANTLAAAFPIAAIVVAHERHRRRLRVRRRSPLRVVIPRVGLLFFWRAVRDARQKRSSLVRVLSESLTADFQRANLVRRVQGVNSDASRELLAELRPDLILVYGTAIVADQILELAIDLALNMHTGISPYYRGADTWFWPVIKGDLHMVGATVHQCTSAVDGGPIFKTARAPLEPSRNIYDLFAWSVLAGTEIYVQVVRDYLAGNLHAQPQDLSIGREYKSAERTLARELAARRLIRAGIVDEHLRNTDLQLPIDV